MSEATLDFSNLNPRDYTRFFLSDNPFPAIPVPDNAPSIMVDREDTLKAIQDVIVDALRTGKSQTLVMQGNIGSGKSHLLKFTKFKINSDLGNNRENSAIAAYVTPGKEFFEFYSQTAKEVTDTIVKNASLVILSNSILADIKAFTSRITDPSRLSSVTRFVAALKDDPRSASQITDISYPYIDYLADLSESQASKSNYKLKDFPKACMRMIDQTSVASRWIRGEPLSKFEKDTLGVTGEIDSYNAIDAFHDLRLFLNQGGYRVLFILFDELEKVSELPPQQKSHYFDTLRNMIDENVEGAGWLATVTPVGFAEMQASGHPLYRRFLTNNKHLSAFSQDMSVALATEYMKRARQEYLRASGQTERAMSEKILQFKGADVAVFPFSLDAVKLVCDLNLGNIGDMLTSFHQVLNEAYDKSRWYINDLDFVRRIIKPAES